MGKDEDPAVKSWEALLSEVREEDRDIYDDLIKCKPDRSNKRLVWIYTDKPGEWQKKATAVIKKVSRGMYGQGLRVKWLEYHRAEASRTTPTPEIDEPEPVMAPGTTKDIKFPRHTTVIAHYHNNRILLTSLGPAKCRDARAFRLGLKVPVHKEGDWLVIKGTPRTPTKF